MKDAQGHGSNSRGSIGAHAGKTDTVGRVQLYRGEYSGNKGGNFYTPDREWARQFTQSGQDHEIKSASIESRHVFDAVDTYAGDPDRVDEAVARARAAGAKAVRLNEGSGQPHSIYVFDKSGLRR